MQLPFTDAEFFAVFSSYNEAVWPAQVVLYALALTAVFAAARGTRAASVTASAILAFLWAWMAIAYHWLHFRTVNPAAALFAAVFLLQAVLFLWQGVLRDRLALAPPRGWRGWLGGVLIVYALAVYPLLGAASGHPWRELPILGVPCPTTILTFGLLFWARPGLPRWLLVIPLLWAAVGSTAAFSFGVWQDLGLLVAALTALSRLRR